MDSESQTDWSMEGPITSELICWMSFVISWIDLSLIYKFCCESFTVDEIRETRDKLFKLVIPKGDVPAFKKRVSPKPTDSMSMKMLTDIYQVLQEYSDQTKKYKFVAKNLNKLPPIPYECVDATGLFVSYKKLEGQVGIMNECSKSSETILKGMLEFQNSVIERLSALEAKSSTDNTYVQMPFVCTDCGLRYMSENELKSHMVSHTKENVMLT